MISILTVSIANTARKCLQVELLVPFSGFWLVVGLVEQVTKQLTASVLLIVVVVELVVVLIVLIHMYVAGSGLQCPSPVQVAVMMSLGTKPSSQVKVMDDPSNVVV